MIIDTFERGARYFLGECWSAIYPELIDLVCQGEDLPEGRYLLAGNSEKGGVLAHVESYEPKEEAQARYESHERMADIQAVLSGDEFINVFFLHGDEKESMRDEARDLILYEGKPVCAARVHLVSGMFALVMPGEAHMPCLRAVSSRVKKLVVKIPAEFLAAPHSL